MASLSKKHLRWIKVCYYLVTVAISAYDIWIEKVLLQQQFEIFEFLMLLVEYYVF